MRSSFVRFSSRVTAASCSKPSSAPAWLSLAIFRTTARSLVLRAKGRSLLLRPYGRMGRSLRFIARGAASLRAGRVSRSSGLRSGRLRCAFGVPHGLCTAPATPALVRSVPGRSVLGRSVLGRSEVISAREIVFGARSLRSSRTCQLVDSPIIRRRPRLAASLEGFGANNFVSLTLKRARLFPSPLPDRRFGCPILHFGGSVGQSHTGTRRRSSKTCCWPCRRFCSC